MFSKEELSHEIEVQKMIEQFYAMLRASNASPGYALSVGLVRSVERKLKNEGLNILINKFYCVLFGNAFLNQHV